MKCNNHWLPLGLVVDDTTGLVLTVDEPDAENAETPKEWLEPTSETFDAELLVGGDADAFKTVANAVWLAHQVCKSHLKRSSEVLIDSLASLVGTDEDGRPAAVGVKPEQAPQDLKRLGAVILGRQSGQEDELAEMH